MRIITDPVVDSFTFILNKFAMPPLIFIVQTLFSIIRYTAVHLAALFLGRSKALEWSSTLEGMVSIFTVYPNYFLKYLLGFIEPI